jgi:AraC-like DNA-binding protein
MFEDSLQMQFRHEPGYMLEERECNLFNLFPGLHKIPMTNNKKILSLHINIDPSAIPSLVREFPVLQFLETTQSSQISGPVNVHPYHINPACDYLIKQILGCHYTGLKAQKFLYRCCLDLLLNIAQQQAATNQRMLFSTIIYGTAYQQLFKYLETHPHKQHSIFELAYIFAIPAEQLAFGFQQLFSTSIEDFVMMTKMLFAYNRIHSKAFPYSLIAEVTGYKSAAEMMLHVENYYGIRL